MTIETMIRVMGDITIEYNAIFDSFYAVWRDPVGKEQAFAANGDTVFEAVAQVYAKFKAFTGERAA